MVGELEVRTARLADYERSEREKDEEIKILKLQLSARKPSETRNQITVVTPLDRRHIFFRPDENNLLPLKQVKQWIPKIRSLFYCSYRSTGFVNVSVRLENDFFHPPNGRWGDIKYFASETPFPPPTSLPSPPAVAPQTVHYSNIPRSNNHLLGLDLLQQPGHPYTKL